MSAMRLFFCLSLCTILMGCSHNAIDDYAKNQPVLDVEGFFDGQLLAVGVVKNRSGKVIRHFKADIHATWQDGVGTLDEDFIFDDGEEQNRVWTLRPSDAESAGAYIASANDVIGEHSMSLAGNALFMRYVLRIPYGESSIDVAVDDRMFLVTPDHIINESVMTKWGVEVATIQLSIIKL